MANLTITVDGDLLKRARIRALEQGTSVNAVLRSYLEEFVRGREERVRRLRALLKQSRKARSARQGRGWTRSDLHER